MSDCSFCKLKKSLCKFSIFFHIRWHRLYARRISVCRQVSLLTLSEFNFIRPGSCRLNTRQFKMNTILDWFNALVPCCITFIFQVLCIISRKLGQVVLRLCHCAHAVPEPYPLLKIQILVLRLLHAEFLLVIS